MLAPLPSGLRITTRVKAGDHFLEFRPSLGRRLGIWLVVGFLLFWLYGWTTGEHTALREVFAASTPLGARIFLSVWLLGWTVGGVLALLFAVGMAFRRGSETILIEPARLTWRPAYPMLSRFRQGRIAFFKGLLTDWKNWTIAFPREQVKSISIICSRDSEDDTTSEHLVVQRAGEEFELGRDLDSADKKWLCRTLNAWKQPPGSPAPAA